MSKNILPWGRQYKAQMIMQDITLKKLSEKVGLSKTYVSAIINGRIMVPKETTDKISKELNIPILNNEME